MSTATRTSASRLLAALLTLALAEAASPGCGATPRRDPAAYQRQQDYARAGARAWAKGDVRGAIEAHERALISARSVEDETNIALRILDLAALRRAAGEPEAARAALDELLAEPPPLAYPGRWRAGAARLAGLIALDGGHAVEAGRWAGRALSLCRAARCPDEGAIVNLQARAAFLAGDIDTAAALAEKALPLNEAAKDEEEETANSHRIIADARLAAGRHAAAARAYADALDADKQLGLEEKIRLDLVGLGRVAQARGRREEARGYYERAHAVALATGDHRGAAEARALAEALGPPQR